MLNISAYNHDPVLFAEAVLREVGASDPADSDAGLAEVRVLALKLRAAWSVSLTGGDDVAALTLLIDLEEALDRVGLVQSCCRCAF